jgi:hypothetical protein
MPNAENHVGNVDTSLAPRSTAMRESNSDDRTFNERWCDLLVLAEGRIHVAGDVEHPHHTDRTFDGFVEDDVAPEPEASQVSRHFKRNCQTTL